MRCHDGSIAFDIEIDGTGNVTFNNKVVVAFDHVTSSCAWLNVHGNLEWKPSNSIKRRFKSGVLLAIHFMAMVPMFTVGSEFQMFVDEYGNLVGWLHRSVIGFQSSNDGVSREVHVLIEHDFGGQSSRSKHEGLMVGCKGGLNISVKLLIDDELAFVMEVMLEVNVDDGLAVIDHLGGVTRSVGPVSSLIIKCSRKRRRQLKGEWEVILSRLNGSLVRINGNMTAEEFLRILVVVQVSFLGLSFTSISVFPFFPLGAFKSLDLNLNSSSVEGNQTV